jgi:hypothetical protein
MKERLAKPVTTQQWSWPRFWIGGAPFLNHHLRFGILFRRIFFNNIFF